jgi:hypothetical protein
MRDNTDGSALRWSDLWQYFDSEDGGSTMLRFASAVFGASGASGAFGAVGAVSASAHSDRNLSIFALN